MLCKLPTEHSEQVSQAGGRNLRGFLLCVCFQGARQSESMIPNLLRGTATANRGNSDHFSTFSSPLWDTSPWIETKPFSQVKCVNNCQELPVPESVF